jgi:hypothetical protein
VAAQNYPTRSRTKFNCESRFVFILSCEPNLGATENTCVRQKLTSPSCCGLPITQPWPRSLLSIPTCIATCFQLTRSRTLWCATLPVRTAAFLRSRCFARECSKVSGFSSHQRPIGRADRHNRPHDRAVVLCHKEWGRRRGGQPVVAPADKGGQWLKGWRFPRSYAGRPGEVHPPIAAVCSPKQRGQNQWGAAGRNRRAENCVNVGHFGAEKLCMPGSSTNMSDALFPLSA